jgi:hypothetical protein
MCSLISSHTKIPAQSLSDAQHAVEALHVETSSPDTLEATRKPHSWEMRLVRRPRLLSIHSQKFVVHAFRTYGLPQTSLALNCYNMTHLHRYSGPTRKASFRASSQAKGSTGTKRYLQ